MAISGVQGPQQFQNNRNVAGSPQTNTNTTTINGNNNTVSNNNSNQIDQSVTRTQDSSKISPEAQQAGGAQGAQQQPGRGEQITQALGQGLQQVGQAEQAAQKSGGKDQGAAQKAQQALQQLGQTYQGAEQSGGLSEANKGVVKAAEDKLGIKKGEGQGGEQGGAQQAAGQGGEQGGAGQAGGAGDAAKGQAAGEDKTCPNCSSKIKEPLDKLLGNRGANTDNKAGEAGASQNGGNTTINNRNVVNSAQTNTNTTTINGNGNTVSNNNSNSIDQSVTKTKGVPAAPKTEAPKAAAATAAPKAAAPVAEAPKAEAPKVETPKATKAA